MTNLAIRSSGLPVFIISLMAGLLVFMSSTLMSTAKAETFKSITFQVPLNVTNIHPDIKYLAPMCRVFSGNVASNANQIGAVRPDIAVPASREISQKVAMTITKENLSPGKNLDDASLYTCTLYLKTSLNSPLLAYTLTSQIPSTKAVGSAPRNIVSGAIKAGRSKAITVNTSQLKAKGTHSPSARPMAGKKPPTVEVLRKVETATNSKPRRTVDSLGTKAVTPGAGIALDRRALGPEPVITSWSPQTIAHPGQVLVIEGRDFKPGSFVIQLQGEDDRTINLKIFQSTPTRIEAEITEFDYTGYDGAKLVAFQRGGKRKTLDDDYKIVNEDLAFKGDSLWRVGPHAENNIFTSGAVTLTLEKFEFSNSGVGRYQEKVELIGPVNSYTRTCGRNVSATLAGERLTTTYDFKEQNIVQNLQWRKLADGRIEIQGLGQGGVYTATGQISDDIFNMQFIEPVTYAESFVKRGDCDGVGNKLMDGLVGADDASLRAAPERLVEWSLLRTTP